MSSLCCGAPSVRLACPAHEVRRFEEAITAQQDAIAICREVGDRRGEGVALSGLGAALREVGRFEEAITAQQDAAAISREAGDRHSEGVRGAGQPRKRPSRDD